MAQATITVWPNGRGSDAVVYDLLNDPQLQGADPTKIAATLQDLIQADFETVQKVKDLPDDEPCKNTDPADLGYGECCFWRGQGGNKELVGRSQIISVSYDSDNSLYVVKKRRPNWRPT